MRKILQFIPDGFDLFNLPVLQLLFKENLFMATKTCLYEIF